MTLHTPVYAQPVAGDANFPNGIPFSAQELRRSFQALLSAVAPASQSGVTPLDGQFAVTQRAAGANFSVDVAAGHAFVLGTDVAFQGVYGCWNDAVANVTVPGPPASGTEVHRLVLQVKDRFNNALWTGYTANLILLADTGSGTPAQPASSITLALISVSAGQASVLNANIADQRPMLGSVPLSAVKSATQSVTSSTVPVNDTALVLPMAANATYIFDLIVIYTGGPTGASDLSLGGNLPPGSTSSPFWWLGPNLANGFQFGTNASLPGLLPFGTNGAVPQVLTMHGSVTTGATAGNLQLQWAQNTSNATPTNVLPGSVLRLEKAS